MWLELLVGRLLLLVCKLQLIRAELCAACVRLAAVWSYQTPEEECVMPLWSGKLRFRRHGYSLERKIAAGDLCDVHLASAGGERFVWKASRITSSAADVLLEKEMDVLRQLTGAASDHYRSYFPEPVDSLAERDRLANVLSWREGYFTSGEILTRYPNGLDGRHLAWMFKRILAALGYVHRQGWVHGAVTPPHLLFHAENHGLQLIDWIHAVPIGEPLTIVPAQFKAWYPPEVRHGAIPASDIYLAAKSLMHLAGGDPVRNLIPNHVPRPMRSFVEGCLLESTRMRPQDAWELHEEFDELLGELYGRPKFVRLEI